MKILMLNGSPRPNGNTATMISALAAGAVASGHKVDVVNVCQKNIHGCLGCEYCHTKGNGSCIQNDDMQKIYPLLEQAEMIVLASPIYYHRFSGQLQCTLNRIYALDKPKNLRACLKYFDKREGKADNKGKQVGDEGECVNIQAISAGKSMKRYERI